jgi:hypothetical protein
MIKIVSILLIIFLPKYGIIDLSFFFSTAVVAYHLIVLKKVVSQVFSNVIIFLCILIVYFLVLALVNLFLLDDVYTPYYLAKFVRLLMSFVAIYYLINKFDISHSIKLLNYVFVINLLVIFFLLFFPDHREFIYGITGFYNSAPVVYRVAGLSLGFDAAGMIVVFGGLYYLSKISFRVGHKHINISLYIMHLAATLFTARVAVIALLIVSFLYAIIILIVNIRKNLKIFLYLLLTSSLYYLLYELPSFEFLNFNFSGYENAFDRTTDISRMSSDIRDLITSLKVVENPFHAVFGYGVDPFTQYGARSDVGYYQMYWAAGIFGATIITLFYGYLFIYSLLRIRKNIFSLFIVLAIIAIAIGNLKGGYVFARQQTEILFIFVILLKMGVGHQSNCIEKN